MWTEVGVEQQDSTGPVLAKTSADSLTSWQIDVQGIRIRIYTTRDRNLFKSMSHLLGLKSANALRLAAWRSILV